MGRQLGDPITPADQTADADDSELQRARRAARRRLPGGRYASPWSRRLVLGAVVIVVVLAPLWLDPLTLATITGSRATPAPPAEESYGRDVTGPGATDDPSLIWTAAAADDFARTVAQGWGTAGSGGDWQAFPASATGLSVDGAAHAAVTTSALSGATLAAVGAHNSSVLFTVDVPPPSTVQIVVGAVVRATTEGSGYLAAVVTAADGTVQVTLQQFDATGAHALAVPVTVANVPATAGSVMRVRAQVTGIDPATLKVRAWPADQPEPGTWQQSVVDWTGVLQHDGRIGLGWMLAVPSNESGQVTIDDFAATRADAGSSQ